MAKTFDQLRADEICIYQAFAAYTGLTPRAVSDFVAAAHIELDDGAALVFLANRYGFNKVEVVLAADYTSGNYNFDTNSNLILAVTRSQAVRVKAGQWRLLADQGARASRNATDLLTDPELAREVWHAIYGATGAGVAVVWNDTQRIYPNGPNGESLAVCFIRR